MTAGRQRIPDSWGNETERTVANTFEIAFRDFQEFFVLYCHGPPSLKRQDFNCAKLIITFCQHTR